MADGTSLSANSSAASGSSTPLCSSDALKGVTFGQKPHSECAAASSYSFFLITEPPTAAQLAKMCSISACKTTMEAIENVCPLECALSTSMHTNQTMELYRDVLTPMKTQCGFDAVASDAESGPLLSTSGETTGGDDTAGGTVQTTSNADESSSMGIGVVFSLVLGAMMLGLLAAFAVHRYKRRSQDGTSKPDDQLYEHEDQHQQSVSVYEESDDFISQRDYDDFAAIAVSSKVSSSVSRASTASSQHQSIGSYGESGMRSSLTVDSAGIQLDDPVLAPLRIRFDQVHIGRLISRDGSVEVYQGKYKSSPVTIRKLVPERRHKIKEVERFLDETKVMASLHHARILGFIGVAWETLMLDLCSVSEYATGGDLCSWLAQNAVQCRPVGFDRDKIKIALHIAEALSYLHSLDPVVLHRNLRPHNVLLTHSLDAVLMNVGVYRDFGADTADTSVYEAPEVARGLRYDEQADVYAFGVLLSTLDTHQPQHTGSGEVDVVFSESADPEMVAIAQSCIAGDPRDRPSASQLVVRIRSVLKSYVAFV